VDTYSEEDQRKDRRALLGLPAEGMSYADVRETLKKYHLAEIMPEQMPSRLGPNIMRHFFARPVSRNRSHVLELDVYEEDGEIQHVIARLVDLPSKTKTLKKGLKVSEVSVKETKVESSEALSAIMKRYLGA